MTWNQRTVPNCLDLVAVARAATEARLDAALADTFPASDPVAITVCEPPRRPQGDGGRPRPG
jgi:hypothetical protein